MHFENIVLIVLSVVLFKWCDGHPTGAPESTCEDLKPHHGNTEPMTSKSPFVLKGRPKNDSIELIIESPEGTPFRGFAIQARLANASSGAIGKFIVKGKEAHTIKCFEMPDNTVTHSDRSEKHQMIVDWFPPMDDNHHIQDLEIVFFGTVVHRANQFWTNLSSDKINVASHYHAHPNDNSHLHKESHEKGSNSSSFQTLSTNFLIVSLILLFFRKF